MRAQALIRITSGLPLTVDRLVAVAVVLFVAVVLNWVVRRAIGRFVGNGVSPHDHAGRRRRLTIASALRTVASAIILGVGGLSALSNAGINVGPVIATAGVAGVALGIGGQFVVRDLIAG